MRQLPFLLLLGFAPGCAQLAGIDETTGGSTPGVSSLSIERISVGATIQRAPLDLDGLTASYLVADAAGPGGFRRIEAVSDGTTWTAPLETPAPVLFEIPILDQPLERNALRLFDFPNADLKLPIVVLERPGAEPPPADATLTVDVTLDVPYVDGEQLTMVTMGAWNTRGLTPPLAGSTVVGPEAFPYLSMATINNLPHVKLTTADLVFVTRHLGGQLTGVAEATPFEQTGADTVSTMMLGTPADQPLTLNLTPAQTTQRFAAARPAFGPPSFDWHVRTGPGSELGSTAIQLHGGGLAVDTTQLLTSYAHPFAARGWLPIVQAGAIATRTYTSPGGASLTLFAAMFDRATAVAEQSPMFPAGFPERISINQTSLSTDNVMIPFPVAPVEIQIETDRPTNAYYQATLYELVPSADNLSFTVREVVTAYGLTTRFLLPPELFLAGRQYVIRAHAFVGGFPDLASGDLTNISPESSVGLVDSGVFGVM